MTAPDKQIAPATANRGAAEGGPPLGLQRKLGTAFGAASLVLFVGFVALMSIRQLASGLGGMTQASGIARELQAVTGGFADAESSLLGYLLTGQDTLLGQHDNAVIQTRQAVDRALAGLSQHRELRSGAPALRNAAQRKLEALQSLRSAASAEGRDSAIAAIRAGAWRQEADSLRAVVQRLTRAEQDLFTREARRRDRSTRLALWLVLAASSAAFLLLVAVLITVRRGVEDESRLQQYLVKQTERLDTQATELERRNEQLQEQAVSLEEKSSRLVAQQTELENANKQLLRANAEVEASRERLQLLLQSAESGMYGIDSSGVCTFINPAGARILGYAPQELIGERIHDRVHYAKADGTPYPFEKCPIRGALITGARARRDDEVYWRKDGTRVFIDYTAAPMVTKGEVRGAVVSFMDISARKREEDALAFLADATAALNSSLNYHETLAKVADLAVPRLGDWCTIDVLEDGRLQRLAAVHRDPGKLRMVDEMTTRRPPRLDAPLGSGKIIRTGRPELIEELPEELLVASAEGDVEVIKAMQSLGLRSLLGVPLSVKGRPIGAIVWVMAESGRRFADRDLRTAEDLAARASLAIENALLFREAEEARQRAEAADHAKSQFLASMSHELRTPLNAIGGYAELLMVGVHGTVTEKQREALERIIRSQKTLLSLINDILNFSRLQAGFVQVSTEDVPLAEALDGIEAWVEPQLRTKQLQYSYDPCPVHVLARGDREKIQQVILNLLSNAVKFTPTGGAISVKCTHDDDSIAIAVRDTGPGIPPDKVEAIFEPFVQVDRGVQSSYQGTGLGLAISRDLARAMGGEILVESSSAEGSTFLFTLKRAYPGDQAATEPTQP